MRLPKKPGCLGGLPGYPSTSSVAGSVCRDPYCKDPNCPTAVYNAYMARVSAARGLPPGYLELMEAHKMAALGLGGLGSPPPSRIPLIPMLSGGNDLGVGAFERSASAEKGDALGGATCTGGFVVRSTVRSEGWCW